MQATNRGHLDVVNRLLDCKQIDVNVHGYVSENIDCVISNSLSYFFVFDVFFIKILLTGG